jgi:hypothetical protein
MTLLLQPTPLDELVQDYHSTISLLLIHLDKPRLLLYQPLHVSDESHEGEASGNATPNSGAVEVKKSTGASRRKKRHLQFFSAKVF